MRYLNITYHMEKNHGTVIEPNIEIAETCIVLPMAEDVAEDVLISGADSIHLKRLCYGKVSAVLAALSELQGYHYSGFCCAEEVTLTERGYAPIN